MSKPSLRLLPKPAGTPGHQLGATVSYWPGSCGDWATRVHAALGWSWCMRPRSDIAHTAATLFSRPVIDSLCLLAILTARPIPLHWLICPLPAAPAHVPFSSWGMALLTAPVATRRLCSPTSRATLVSPAPRPFSVVIPPAVHWYLHPLVSAMVHRM